MDWWQDIGDILHPARATFTRAGGNGGDRLSTIYDGSPRLASRQLATTLDGLLKPKSANWFGGTVDDDEIAESEEAKTWFEIADKRMWSGIYRPRARFTQKSGEVDNDLVGFGTGVLWCEENRDLNGLLFRSHHLSRVVLGENEEGVIDQIGVEEDLTPGQAVKRFGEENISDKVKDAGKNPKSAEKKFPFVQLVLPRDDRDAQKLDAGNLAFASVVIDLAGEKIAKEGGFYEFPASVPRWGTVQGEIFGQYCPGMYALPDSKTLQAMGKTLLVAGQRAVDPPLWAVSDSVVSSVRNFPGGVTFVDPDATQGGAPIGAFPTSLNLPIGRDMQQDYRQQVEAAFFRNVFNLPIDGPRMTATEILERKEEFVRTLGPIFGRLETDYIGTTIERVFGIMERAGAFPDRPDILIDRQISFTFQSPIQTARKQIEVAGLSRSLEILAPVFQFQPEIADNFDGDAITRDAPDWGGIPSDWLRTKDEVEEIRGNRAQQQQAEQTLTAAPQIADTLATISNI